MQLLMYVLAGFNFIQGDIGLAFMFFVLGLVVFDDD